MKTLVTTKETDSIILPYSKEIKLKVINQERLIPLLCGNVIYCEFNMN